MFRPGNPMPGAGRRSAEGEAGRGQPRPLDIENARVPSAAERVRSLVEGNCSALLLIPGPGGPGGLPAELMTPYVRTCGRDGDVLLRFAPDSPAVRAATFAEDDELPAVVELTDVAPVAVARRIRGRARIGGWLTPWHRHAGPGWLRLEVGEAWVDDLWGADHVEPDDFAAAAADPLARQEAELLQHLAAAHGEQVGRLCALAACGRGAGRCGAPHTAVPLALDRFGLRVRFTGDDGTFDARFEFPEPVHGPNDLRRAMHALFEAAHECAVRRPGT